MQSDKSVSKTKLLNAKYDNVNVEHFGIHENIDDKSMLPFFYDGDLYNSDIFPNKCFRKKNEREQRISKQIN